MPESEHQQVIDDLIKERHLIQSSASRFIKFVKNFNNTNNIRNLSTRLADFRPVLNKFNKVQFEIDLKSNEEDEALRDAFESEYYDAIARAEEILERGTMQSSSNATDIKLPTINLPNFNGNYTDWTPFYESFRSLIHENNNLEKIQKLQKQVAEKSRESKWSRNSECQQINRKISTTCCLPFRIVRFKKFRYDRQE
jgi:hypothetical protein